jgi:hypothetical protein
MKLSFVSDGLFRLCGLRFRQMTNLLGKRKAGMRGDKHVHAVNFGQVKNKGKSGRGECKLFR